MSVGAGGLRWSYQCAACTQTFLWPPVDADGGAK